jgi:hypothetical protein
VLDKKTKLTWQQTPPAAVGSQAAAKAYCSTLSLGGSGWRLPTVKELLTLVDYSQTVSPVIDQTAFPGTPSGVFISSTPAVSAPNFGWFVSFSVPGGAGFQGAPSSLQVRCVH